MKAFTKAFRKGSGRPSIYDVARRAKVSIATVSRTIAGLPSVAPATGQRVRECMAAIGYRPNALARAFSTRVKRSAGLIVAAGSREYADLFLAEILGGITTGAAAEGWSIHLTMLPAGDEDAADLIDRHVEQVDGSLVLDIAADAAAVRRLLRSPHPTVILNRAAAEAGVAIENETGARLAAEHLIGLGHRRIACLVANDAIGRARRAGYRAALGAAGLKAHAVIDCDFKFEAAAEATERLLRDGAPPSAILAASDWMALGVLEAARRRDVAVPDELSVIGFDDAIVAGIASPPLTTVRQPLGLLGRTAFEALIRRIRSGVPEPLITLAPELVARASTTRRNDE